MRKLISEGKVKVSLFLFVFVLAAGSRAQESPELPFKMAFKWAPFGLFDFFSGPNMKVGFDYHIYKNVYGGIDGGGIIIPYPPQLKNNSGFFARKELKFFRIDDDAYNSGTFYYWGIELMYKYQQFGRGDSISIPNVPTYFKEYTMYRNTGALHLKAGGIIYFLKDRSKVYLSKEMPTFFLEFFGGVGIRQTNSYCAGLTTKEADNRKYDKLNVFEIFNLPNGFRVWPSFLFSVKFGWKMF